MSLRGITRPFGGCRKTVSALGGGKKRRVCPRFVDTLLPGEKGDVLELDELWSFVGAKTQTLWLWVALCRRTRQIVARSLGDRSEQGAADLHAALPPGYRRCATRRDLWRAYRAAFPTRTHRCCRKKEGETCHVERWFCTLRQRVGRLVRQALVLLQARRKPPRRHPSFHHHLQPLRSTQSNSQVATTASTAYESRRRPFINVTAGSKIKPPREFHAGV